MNINIKSLFPVVLSFVLVACGGSGGSSGGSDQDDTNGGGDGGASSGGSGSGGSDGSGSSPSSPIPEALGTISNAGALVSLVATDGNLDDLIELGLDTGDSGGLFYGAAFGVLGLPAPEVVSETETVTVKAYDCVQGSATLTETEQDYSDDTVATGYVLLELDAENCESSFSTLTVIVDGESKFQTLTSVGLDSASIGFAELQWVTQAIGYLNSTEDAGGELTSRVFYNGYSNLSLKNTNHASVVHFDWLIEDLNNYGEGSLRVYTTADIIEFPESENPAIGEWVIVTSNMTIEFELVAEGVVQVVVDGGAPVEYFL